jgi:type I restriction enzyme S subunit
MQSEWKLKSLRDAGVSLIDCDHRTPPPAETGYPYIAIPQLRKGRLDLSDVRRISHEHFLDWTRKAKPHPNDVVLSRRCNPGETAVVPAGLECALGQNLVLLRADDAKMFPPFLRWLVRGADWWEQIAKFLNVGAVFDSLRCADIPNFQLPIPPISEQRAIASVLGALDNKIELNRQTNETLEAMARALFQNWFVDATQARLPTGWRAGTLNEIVNNPRRGIQPDEIKSSTPYIGLEHMPRRCIALSEWGHADELESNKFEFECGEILFGKLRPYFHKVGVAPVDGVCSTDILVLRPKAPEWFGFVLGHVSSVELVNHTTAASTGTKMPRANWNDIARFEVALPPDSLAAEFTATIRPMIDRIIANIHESRTLAELRDALLPKLLSGELRVNGEEKSIGRPK